MKRSLFSLLLALMSVLIAHADGFPVTLQILEASPAGNQWEGPENIIDGNDKTKWCCEHFTSGQVVFRVLDSNVPITELAYMSGNDVNYNGKNRNPAKWTLEGRNAGEEEWKEVANGTGETLPTQPKVQTYIPLPEHMAYKYYRLTLEGVVNEGTMEVGEIGLNANLEKYLTLTAVDDEVKVSMNKIGSPNNYLLEYTNDPNSGNWTVVSSLPVFYTSLKFTIPKGETYYLRRSGTSDVTGFSKDNANYWNMRFDSQKGRVKVGGNIMSLLSRDNPDNVVLSDYVFYRFFSGAECMVQGPSLLPATKLAPHCYEQMFLDCRKLENAPILPASELTEACYLNMFEGCDELTSANLSHAKTLQENSMQNMFYGCDKLTEVLCDFTNISATDCLKDWLKDTAEDTTGILKIATTKGAKPSALPSNWQTYVMGSECDHSLRTIFTQQIPTCLVNGIAEHFICRKCEKMVDREGTILKELKDIELGIKPTVVLEHVDPTFSKGRFGFWKFSNSMKDGDKTYFNVASLEIRQFTSFLNKYVLNETILDIEKNVNLHIFSSSSLTYNITVKFKINGETRSELTQILPNDNKKHHFIVPLQVKQYDQISIQVITGGGPNDDPTANIQIAWEKDHTIKTPQKHEIHAASTYDCVEGGYYQHNECRVCGHAFEEDYDINSDKDIVSIEKFFHEPIGQHTFAITSETTPEGLLKYRCSHDICRKEEPDHYMIPQCMGPEDVEIRYIEKKYVAPKATLHDGYSINSPFDLTIEEMEYDRQYPEKIWNAWFTPFDVNASYLKDNGLTPAYIEGIHNYDDNEDGTIDRTVMEIVKISNGRLRAGTPLLVRATEGYSEPLVLSDVTMKANSDIHSLQSSTTTSVFNFIGTYTGTTAAAKDNIYSLSTSDGAMVHRTGTILPLRWYCKIEQKPSFIGEETPAPAPALARAIYIRVIGEEDQTTGIRTLYDEADQTLERADGIFDLSGRKLTAPQHGKINIVNGKKQFVK